MMNTTNSNSLQPPLTEGDILKAIDALKAPRLVGDLMGIPVYVSDTAPDEIVEIRSETQVVRFWLDHALIKGTKLEQDIKKLTRD
jgi:hypothetical protein